MVYAQPGLSAIWNPKTEVVAWFSLLAMLAGLVGVAVGLFWGLRQLRGFGWRFKLAFGVFATTGPVLVFLASISLFRLVGSYLGRRCPFEGVSLFGDTLSALSEVMSSVSASLNACANASMSSTLRLLRNLLAYIDMHVRCDCISQLP